MVIGTCCITGKHKEINESVLSLAKVTKSNKSERQWGISLSQEKDPNRSRLGFRSISHVCHHASCMILLGVSIGLLVFCVFLTVPGQSDNFGL